MASTLSLLKQIGLDLLLTDLGGLRRLFRCKRSRLRRLESIVQGRQLLSQLLLSQRHRCYRHSRFLLRLCRRLSSSLDLSRV